MISILFESSNRNIAKIIADNLKKNNFLVNTKNISDVFKENNIEAVVLVFSKKTDSSEQIIKEYNFALENQISVIPFFITKPENTLTHNFFVNSHDWINAYDTNTNDAANDLVTLLNEIISAEHKVVPSSKNINKTGSNKLNKTNKKSKQKIIIIIVSLIFVLIIAYLIYDNLSSKTNTNNTEQIIPIKNNSSQQLIGDWKMADYQDNVPRSGKNLIDFQNTLLTLKKNFLLKIKEDGTFEKYGFSQPEKGDWQYDPQNKIIYMWPPNAKGKDLLKVEKLTEDTLIFSIASKVDSLNVITTRFTLYK